MRGTLSRYWTVLFVALNTFLFSQNETSKWYFGIEAGLDFMTSPPTVLTNGVIWASEGCSSISDAAGNLLFYTDGLTVWDATHAPMANGTGLLGSNNPSQSSIIVKQPGSNNIYFIFTVDGSGGTNGFNYSTVDMTLAAGNGSITSKNVSIYPFPSSEKLTAVKHCNGVDVWVIIRDWDYFSNLSNTNHFRSYLVTAAGVSMTPVVSPASTYSNSGTNDYGCMKVSPNGKKLGVAMSNYYYNNTGTNSSPFEIYDFNNTTGVISNSLALNPNTPNVYAYYIYPYGCEFSPDGTKFYGSNPISGNYQNDIIQWDLCAGSNTAIVASAYTVTSTFGNLYPGSLQLAMDGKIYGARWSLGSLITINNPNLAGAACNLVISGLNILPGSSYYGLPNFVTSFFNMPSPKPPVPAFTHTINTAISCLTASFTAPTITINCPATDYSVTSIQWLFGDPLSGPANTSTLFAPIHTFPSPGTYSTQLIFFYDCGTDTVTLPITIPTTSASLLTSSITCVSPGSATFIPLAGMPPYSYTWTPSAQSGSTASFSSPGIYSVIATDNSGTCIFTATTSFVNPPPLTGTVSSTGSLTCYGVNTGTASVSLSGGTGTYSYLWNDGVVTQTNSIAAGLGAGAYTVSVVDVATSCSITANFLITQPPGTTLNIASSSPTACLGSIISFTASNSGGIPGPGYSYTWTAGPTSNIYTVSPLNTGNHSFSVTSSDANNCTVMGAINISIINNPTVTVSSISICPQETGTLTAFGASSYTWNTGITGNTFSDTPLSTSNYTVSGELLGCSSTATATITLKALPTITLSSNTPICAGQALSLTANTGLLYQWSGPNSFSSNIQNPVVSGASISNSGIYTLTLTAMNNCSATATHTALINPTPTVSIGAGTVCVNQTLGLFSNSPVGSTLLWVGPNSFTSSLQNPSIANSNTLMSGVYNLTVVSAAGCSATSSATALVVTAPTIGIIPNYPVLCEGSNLVLSGTGGNSYLWSGPGTFSSNQQTISIPNASVSNSGTYSLTSTTGPCTVSTTQTITINPLPIVIAGHLPVCSGGNLQLTANTGASYLWIGPAAFNSTLQAPARSPALPAYSGVYNLTLTDINNCQASANTTVLVLPNPTISVTSTTVCFGSMAILLANGGSSYSWSGPGGYNYTSSLPGATVNPATDNSSGIYVVTGTSANSCTASAMATLSVTSLPIPIITTTSTVCLNSTITLQGSGGISYVWKGPYNFASTDKDVLLQANNLSMGGTYSLTVTNIFGCSASTASQINIIPPPKGVLLSETTRYCTPFCSNFTIKPSDGFPIMSTWWQVGNQFFSSNTFSYCIQKPGTTIFKATFMNAKGCSNTSTFSIETFSTPTADFTYTPESIVENTDEISFTSTSFGNQLSEFNWFFIDNDHYKLNTPNASFFFETAGAYPVSLVVKNIWGCADTVVKIITINSAFDIYVPTAFTPNGDNRNDTFQPKGVGVTKYDLKIFNRWGEKVFSTTDFLTGWDGTLNGVECKSEVYAWKIKASDTNGNSKDLKGFVTLYR